MVFVLGIVNILSLGMSVGVESTVIRLHNNFHPRHFVVGNLKVVYLRKVIGQE